MTSISTVSTHNDNIQSGSGDTFNDDVLKYISQNKPGGTLNDLLLELKGLSSNSHTMQELTNALLYCDTALKNDPEYQDYTSEVLDKQTEQLLSLNMLTNSIMYGMLSSEDEDSKF